MRETRQQLVASAAAELLMVLPLQLRKSKFNAREQIIKIYTGSMPYTPVASQVQLSCGGV